MYRYLIAAMSLVSVLGASATARAKPGLSPRAKAAQYPAAKRALLDTTFSPTQLRTHFGFQSGTSWGGSGHTVKNQSSAEAGHSFATAVRRIIDLDANKKLLGAKDWETLSARVQHGLVQVSNHSERLDFVSDDGARKLADVRIYEEKARGKLAAKLADALRGKKPSPAELGHVAAQLAAEHPYLSNPYKVEMLIADTRRMYPELGHWDFRVVDQKRIRATSLPTELQDVVRKTGYRAFAHANVLFASHLYKDAMVMADMMMAAGLDPERTRFVATPYPFAPKNKQGLEALGIKTAHAPYSVEETHKHVENALSELIAESKRNAAPILVYDDGGLAAHVIADKFPDEMHRFRIVEITKSGERVAKSALTAKLRVDMRAFSALTRPEMDTVKKRYMATYGYDDASAKKAEANWGQSDRRIAINNKDISQHGLYGHQNFIDARVFGFAHYTYSDTKYKREVMTPLYSEQVNLATFEAIASGGHKLANQRVTIIGGGAMGMNAGLDLQQRGHDVTFVEPDAARAELLRQKGFHIAPLHDALPGRSLILEMSGVHKILGVNELFRIDDGAFIAQGSSKNNPFDMPAITSIAEKREEWAPNKRLQRSATYHFSAAGQSKKLHFLGDGFTISHGGAQNVPLQKFAPEIAQLFALGVHALENRPSTHFPFFSGTSTE